MAPTLEDELKLEDSYRHMAMAKLKECLTARTMIGEGSKTVMGVGVINHLYETLAHNMQVFVTSQLAPHGGVKPVYTDFLKWLDSVYEDKDEFIGILCLSTLSKVIDRSTMRGAEAMDLSISSVARLIGGQLLEEGTVQEFINQTDEKTLKGLIGGLKTRNSDFYRRYYAMQLMTKSGWKIKAWDKREYTLLGGKLLEILVLSSDFFEIKGAQGDQVDQIVPTQKFLDTWAANEDYTLLHAHTTCPMIIPPCDWTSYEEGGYYGDLRPYSKFLRLFAFSDCGIFFKQYMAKLKASDMSEPMEAVNAIQKTPWRIDTKVLEVVKKVIELGGERAGIPRIEPFEGLPKLVNPTEEELKEHKHKLFLMYKKEASRKGKVLRVLANVKTAEYFKSYEKIYFPCNVDFRGRVYPIPSFSFQGDDLNKGLLQFADVPPITDESSERWFLIAGAEFAGIDKVSFDEEIKWVKENHKNIMDSASDPIGMISWWGELDCPWEFLQFCFEYAQLQEWKETHGGSIIGWKTGVPVAFDGTCSGLQHFSAILRDPVGAEAVNLKPSDKPQDIYGRVAEVVNKQLEKDAKEGTIDEWEEAKNRTKFGTKTLAQLWLTFGVNRKVTKRSVMTLAYGSKEFGFRDQVLEDTIRPHLDEGIFTDENANQAAGYMAKLIWTAVRKVVVKAVEGMEWLQKVARLVCRSENVVRWTTPMGLLIQQTYLTTKVKVYKLRFAQTQKRFYVPYTTGDVNDRKQANAIAPNFIHSMDASHLQFTVRTANSQGINHFAMIHDSYGTNVAQAGQLFATVRECFVKMYTDHDVLAEFAEEMKPFISNDADMPPLPTKGDFDLNQVKDSLYAFH